MTRQIASAVLAGAVMASGLVHAQTAPTAPEPTRATSGAEAATPPAATPAAPAAAAPAAPATVTLPAPGMNGPLAFAANPYQLDVGPLGKWYVDGVLSGLGLVQSNATAIDKGGLADLSNGQIIVQKIDGLVQFYVEAGGYSIPSLGSPYNNVVDVSHALNNYFGAVPEAYLKIQPTDTFSIQGGKLATLIGAEYNFTFQNFNIERGLLWNQEPLFSRGIQANYTAGPVALALQFNDGYYSNRFNTLSGSAAWTINPTNTLTFAAQGNLGHTGTNTLATPLFQNNSSIFNLIYTYNSAPWIITPYLQFSHVATYLKDALANPSGAYTSASTYGAALLVSYAVDPKFVIAARGEFEGTDNAAGTAVFCTPPTLCILSVPSANLLYGAGSKAFSLTVTPTYMINHFFVRAEASLVDIIDGTSGSKFGSSGNASTQVRGLLEGGVVF